MTGAGFARPVVYLGPSAPPEAILAHLPGAVIRPPLARGGLIRDRLLRFSTFLIVDGVFAQEDAVPPREVVDVLRDGATVIGAASMGALRAADCAPAGARGVGLVHRLVRRGVLSSEDEVAVLFDPDRPYPSLSTSLVTVRVGLRRAVRAGILDRATARRVADAAAALHFSRRSWATAFGAAGLGGEWPGLRPFLGCHDVKRDDAIAAAGALARLIASGGLADDLARRFPGLGRAPPRERPIDDLAGQDEHAEAARFAGWMWASGRALRYLPQRQAGLTALGDAGLDRPPPFHNGAAWTDACVRLVDFYAALAVPLRTSGRFAAEWHRHCALSAAIRAAPRPDRTDLRLAELRIAVEAGVEDWGNVVALAGDAARWCEWARDRLATGAAWRRTESRGPETPYGSRNAFRGGV